MYDFLAEIKEACKQYQKLREGVAPNIVEKDPFTQSEVARFGFSKKDERMALRIAVILRDACKQGEVILCTRRSFHTPPRNRPRDILAAISELADKDNPDLQSVAVEVDAWPKTRWTIHWLGEVQAEGD